MVGLDEAGRGPLAGPVVAGAVLLKSDFNKLLQSDFNNIRDSKKLSAKQREKFYKILTHHTDVEWGIGMVSEKIIDKINILEATKLAMQKAVKNLEFKMLEAGPPTIDFLILDGNFSIKSAIPQKSIIKADEKVFSCSCASIIAKVTRDRLMLKYDKKYPNYGFAENKGYPTGFHRQMLKKYGPCKIHRKTFRPLFALDKSMK